jgi:hypothetical protein
MMIRLFLVLFLAAPCFAQFLWNENHLLQVKKSLRLKNSPYAESFKSLQTKAASLLQEDNVSVMDKKHVPASGDKHDYTSLSRYYWPDSSKPDGLPYVFRDGISNPELKEYDRESLEMMSRRVQTLTLAWFLSGQRKFAIAALKQVRIWFINKATKMNPHMNYAQMIPGLNDGKGNSFGVLDGYSLVQMMDALRLLESYPGFKAKDKAALKKWFTEYVQWLTTSHQGIEESKAPNNHGTTYDTQLLAYSLYIGDRITAQNLIDHFAERHILKQIEIDGSQPKELKRTQAFHYSWYNLSHMLEFYTIAKNNGFDIRTATEIQERSYFKALDFLTNYIGKSSDDWPYKQLSGWEHAQHELIRDLYRTYLLDSSKGNYRDIYLANKDKVGYDMFYLLYVNIEDL